MRRSDKIKTKFLDWRNVAERHFGQRSSISEVSHTTLVFSIEVCEICVKPEPRGEPDILC